MRKFEMAVMMLTISMMAVTTGYLIARVPVAETFDISVERTPVAPVSRPVETAPPEGAAGAPAKPAEEIAEGAVAPEKPPDAGEGGAVALPAEREQDHAGGTESEPTVAAPGAPVSGAAVDDGAGMVNINTAGIEELQRLPGIGPALAQRIIDERDKRGPYETVDELTRVSGIGEKTVEKLRDGAVV
ncbi:MAG: helix-hairpin-helix domain-containing protein [Oscillospiraceae bacterium]|nr:helix-hairpin-helix domain-containing protein [Oscillospiraceae bacterium]